MATENHSMAGSLPGSAPNANRNIGPAKGAGAPADGRRRATAADAYEMTLSAIQHLQAAGVVVRIMQQGLNCLIRLDNVWMVTNPDNARQLDGFETASTEFYSSTPAAYGVD